MLIFTYLKAYFPWILEKNLPNLQRSQRKSLTIEKKLKRIIEYIWDLNDYSDIVIVEINHRLRINSALVRRGKHLFTSELKEFRPSGARWQAQGG